MRGRAADLADAYEASAAILFDDQGARLVFEDREVVTEGRSGLAVSRAG